MKSTIALVGGFLGSGKTTLMWEIAQRLMQDGKKVGMVTNDAPVDLVNVPFVKFMSEQTEKGMVQQAFCNYRGFSDAIEKVRKQERANVILAEPADSCMAISATILKRLKDEFEGFNIAPYTVVIDPERLEDLLVGRDTLFNNSTLYTIGIQIEMADVIALNKADRLPRQEIDLLIKKAKIKWPDAKVIAMSAKTGEGIDEWIDLVTKGQSASFREVEIDERKLAEGRSALSYINTTMGLRGRADWSDFAEDLIDRLNDRFKKRNAAVGHVKVQMKARNDRIMLGNLIGYEKYLLGEDLPWKDEEIQMILNAKVEMPQEELQKIIEEEFKAACDKRDLKM